MAFSSDPALYSNQMSISVEFPEVTHKEYRDTVNLTYKRTANAVNSKVGGFLLLDELNCFKQIYTRNNPQVNRPAYRKVLDLVGFNGGVAIPGGGTVSNPHGIVGIAGTILIYVACTDTIPNFFSVMGYPAAYLDKTNYHFTNPSPNALTQADMICEYVKIAP